MTRHLQLTALVGLVLASTLLVAACEEGPGARPTPAWSPPSWIHGTWTFSNELSSAKWVASRYNVVIDIRASGISIRYDLADLAEDGVVTITHDIGMARGQRYYEVTISAPPSANTFLCFQQSQTVMACYVTVVNQGQSLTEGPFTLTKQG